MQMQIHEKHEKLRDIAINGEIEGPDLISNLPDEALHSIISFLPTKEAVATSIYSKRWRFLWKSLYRISFDLEKINDIHTRSLWNIVGKVLSSLSSNVKFFHLHHFPLDWACPDYLPQWIQLLKNEKKLEGISLSCDRTTVTSLSTWISVSNSGIRKSVIPENIFQGRFLRFVELNGYVLTDALPFKGCVNVKILKLEACFVSEESLIEILNNCELLEKLYLCCRFYFSNYVIIRHQKLELLVIFHMSDDREEKLRLGVSSGRLLLDPPTRAEEESEISMGDEETEEFLSYLLER
ncbi:hypothetical protein HAX54_026350 [Datura stramonium]|uniref:F-box domain-containing protein n=1 Tax=Datura stramonium TaxID=4076 RepID=A0ABS8RK95_DATST|nr:hypothetical protein [Datura stramonium]